jgi:hypothetical protein
MQKSKIDSALSPALRSWIDNCLVPILVKEFLAEAREREKVLDAESRRVAQFAADGMASSEVVP